MFGPRRFRRPLRRPTVERLLHAAGMDRRIRGSSHAPHAYLRHRRHAGGARRPSGGGRSGPAAQRYPVRRRRPALGRGRRSDRARSSTLCAARAFTSPRAIRCSRPSPPPTPRRSPPATASATPATTATICTSARRWAFRCRAMTAALEDDDVAGAGQRPLRRQLPGRGRACSPPRGPRATRPPRSASWARRRCRTSPRCARGAGVLIDDNTGWRDLGGGQAAAGPGRRDQGRRPRAPGPGPRPQHRSRLRHHARRAGGQCRTAELVRRCGDQGAAAALQGVGQAVRDRVLVARPGRHPAHSGRQPQHPDARHQRPDQHGRDPQRRPTTCSGCATRWPRSGLDQDTDVFVTADHGFSTTSKAERDQRGGQAQLPRRAEGLPAARLPRHRSGQGAEPAAAQRQRPRRRAVGGLPSRAAPARCWARIRPIRW